MTVATKRTHWVPEDAIILTTKEYESSADLLKSLEENGFSRTEYLHADESGIGEEAVAIYRSNWARGTAPWKAGVKAAAVGTAATLDLAPILAKELGYDFHYYKEKWKVPEHTDNGTATGNETFEIHNDPVHVNGTTTGHYVGKLDLVAKQNITGDVDVQIMPADVSLDQSGESEVYGFINGTQIDGFVEGFDLVGKYTGNGTLLGNMTGEINGTDYTDYGAQGNVTSNVTLKLNNTQVQIIANENGTWDAKVGDRVLKNVTFQGTSFAGKSKGGKYVGRVSGTDGSGRMVGSGDIYFDKSDVNMDLQDGKVELNVPGSDSKVVRIFEQQYNINVPETNVEANLTPYLQALAALGGIAAGGIWANNFLNGKELKQDLDKRWEIVKSGLNQLLTYRWRNKADLDEEDKSNSIDMVLESGKLPKWLDTQLEDHQKAPTVALVRETFSSEDYQSGKRPDMDGVEYRTRLLGLVQDKFKKAVDLAKGKTVA